MDEDAIEQSTLVRWEFGDLNVTIQMSQCLSPDMVDDILLKSRRQFVAGARQLGVTGAIEASANEA